MVTYAGYVFGISMVFAIVGVLLAERLPEWWRPLSVFLVASSAAMFLLSFVIDYRRKRAAE